MFCFSDAVWHVLAVVMIKVKSNLDDKELLLRMLIDCSHNSEK